MFLPPNVDPQSGDSYNPIIAAIQGASAGAPAPAATPAPTASAPAGGGLASILSGGGGGQAAGGSALPGNPLGNILVNSGGHFLLPLLGSLLGGQTPEQQRLTAQMQAQTRAGLATSNGLIGLDDAIQNANGNQNKGIHAWLSTPAGIDFFVKNGKESTTILKDYLGSVKDKPIAGAPGTIYRDPNDVSKIIAQNPPAAPLVNIENKQEGAYAAARGTALAADRKRISTEADTAQQSLITISQMEQELKDPNFYSGTGAAQVLGIKRLAAAMGLANPDSVTSMENFNAQSKQNLLASLGGHLGNQISDGDRNTMEQTVPGLQNTPYGNSVMLDIQNRLAQRKIQLEILAEKYEQAHNGQLDAGWATAQRDYINANPVFEKGWQENDIKAGILPPKQDTSEATQAMTTPAQRAQQQSGPYAEGTVIRNNKTGETKVLTNGVWVTKQQDQVPHPAEPATKRPAAAVPSVTPTDPTAIPNRGPTNGPWVAP